MEGFSEQPDEIAQLLPYAGVGTLIWLISTFVVHSSSPTDSLVSIARDSGLHMSLSSPLPPLLLHLHAYSGALLLSGVLLQHFLMSLPLSPLSRVAHRLNGYFMLAVMSLMAAAGLAMGPHSAWPHFAAFSVAFAAPWLLWAVALWMSARWRSWRLHRLVANQVFKGCLTVPLSRLCGALVQRTVPSLGEALGYYVGIGAVVAVVAVWEIWAVRSFLLRPCAATAAERRARAKGR